jgi:orotate phosphoribosyltransferase
MVQYRTVSDLDADTRRLARSLPRDVDLIVGIPRSGLLAANLLCLRLNCPMTDVDGLLSRRLLSTGRRLNDDAFDWDDLERVVVVDDSVNTGGEMRRTAARLSAAALPFSVEYAAVYIAPGGYRYVDYWAEVVPNPRVFGWNIYHHPILRHACVDLEGVLQQTPVGTDGGLLPGGVSATVDRSASVPSTRLGWVVSTRPESDRPAVRAWLADNGVAYDRLVLVGGADGADRDESDRAARKAAFYRSTDAKLFLEGSGRQAAEIARLTNRPVYCDETDRMVTGPTIGRVRRRLVDRWSARLRRFSRDPTGFATQAGSYVARTALDRGRLLAFRLGRDGGRR